MVSIAVTMVIGAVLNATAFVGGSALARSLEPHTATQANEERIRHDKAMEAYEQQMGEWRKKQERYQDWLAQKRENVRVAKGNLAKADYSFELFAKSHGLTESSRRSKPKLQWKPSSSQKKWEMVYVGGGMLATAAIASRFL